MADTLRATEAGLKLVDEARRKKGWKKTETLAWWEEAHTRQATLKRFWQPKKYKIDRFAFIGICQAVGVDWTEVAELSEAERRVILLDSNPNAVCPYRGLAAFQEQDAQFFFGRDTFIDRLLTAVREKPFVAVFGLSGSGKSSIVFAGLFPKLRQEGDWLILDCRPGKSPFYRLSRQLAPFLNPNWKNISESTQRRETLKLAATLQEDTKALRNKVAEILQNNPATPHILLVIDQFEELYTNSPEDKQQPFIDCLLTAIQTTPTPLNFNIVITMRDDFLGQALAYRPLVDALHNAEVKLGPMKRNELQEAIEKPAKLQGVEIEDCLTERLLDAVLKQPGLLPCLEFALTQLWTKQKNRVLNHSAYQQIGGVEKALANHAETVYAKLKTDEDRQQVQRIFIQLVNFEENAKDTRRLATCDQIGNNNWHLVQYLADERLVVTGQNSARQEQTVEVVHEALIRGWDLLQKWLKANQQFRAWQERLRTAIDRWKAIEYDESGLWRGRLLLEAEEWVTQRCDEITADELKFIQASRELENRDRTIQQERLRKSQLSEISALISASELRLEKHDRIIALLTAVKAGTKLREVDEPPDEIKQQIIDSLHQTLTGIQEVNRLEGHRDTINQIAFSPDSQTIASASSDKTVKLWKLDGTLITSFYGHTDIVSGLSFSPDGQTIASASYDKTIKFWQLDGKIIRNFVGHTETVNKVVFSPDGQKIASASDDRTIKLWQTDGQLIRTFDHTAMVYDVIFSPDGQILASCCLDGTIRLWKIDGTLLQLFHQNQEPVNELDFSLDGQVLISAHDDRTITIWNLDGKPIRSINQHEHAVTSVRFSPDGKLILSASTDKTIRLWQLDGTVLQIFRGHGNSISSIRFSPDGKTIASASTDKTIRIWQRRAELLYHDEPVRGADFSPNGKIIASASHDGFIRLWNTDGTLVQTFQQYDGLINHSVSFSPNGKMIASAGRDTQVKIWSIDGTLLKTIDGFCDSNVCFSPDNSKIIFSSHPNAPFDRRTVELYTVDGIYLHSFRGHSNRIWSVCFSPDGRLIASASHDATVKIWELDGTLLQTFAEHDDRVSSVHFSPDGRTLVSASHDTTIKLWEIDGKLLNTFQGHSSKVVCIKFSPDGQKIISASHDKTIKLWDLEGKLLRTFFGHTDTIANLSLSPDGQKIVSSSPDKTVRIWAIDSTEGIVDPNTQIDTLLSKGCDWLSNYSSRHTS